MSSERIYRTFLSYLDSIAWQEPINIAMGIIIWKGAGQLISVASSLFILDVIQLREEIGFIQGKNMLRAI